jgi:hypothetical protein
MAWTCPNAERVINQQRDFAAAGSTLPSLNHSGQRARLAGCTPRTSVVWQRKTYASSLGMPCFLRKRRPNQRPPAAGMPALSWGGFLCRIMTSNAAAAGTGDRT